MHSGDTYRLAGTILAGKYRIERAVAEGGFGVVYCGLHLSLEKRIAIKVLKVRQDVSPKLRASIATKFRREAQTLAKLSHPALVQALDLDMSVMPNGDEAPWMVLEWIEGPSLKEWLRARSPGPAMAPEQALALLRPIFEALTCAHDEGIAHRDIKPANIMVDARRNSELRLMDFGIAKLMEDGQEGAPSLDLKTVSEFPSYSAKYAAPEQALGRKTGPWTDVHAMGLLLTEVLTGGTAYREKDPSKLLGETLDERRPTPGNQVPPIDVGPWEPVIARALNRNPGERYPNAAEFLAALENTLPGSAGISRVSIEAVRLGTGSGTPVHGLAGVEPVTTPRLPATRPLQPFAKTMVEGAETAPIPLSRPTPQAVVAEPSGRPQRARGGMIAAGVLVLIGVLSSAGTWFVLGQRRHAASVPVVPRSEAAIPARVVEVPRVAPVPVEVALPVNTVDAAIVAVPVQPRSDVRSGPASPRVRRGSRTNSSATTTPTPTEATTRPATSGPAPTTTRLRLTGDND